MFEKQINELILNLGKVKKDRKAPAFIRLLAYEIENSSGYIQAGEYLENMSEFDFGVLSTLCDILQEFNNFEDAEKIKHLRNETVFGKSVKYFSLLSLILGNSEGFPGINQENVMTFSPNLMMMVIVEKALRQKPEARDKIRLREFGVSDDLGALMQRVKENNL